LKLPRLGLIIQNCWISAISNPQAAQYGWQAGIPSGSSGDEKRQKPRYAPTVAQVGDHILQVNGHPVSNMQQLSEEIRCRRGWSGFTSQDITGSLGFQDVSRCDGSFLIYTV